MKTPRLPLYLILTAGLLTGLRAEPAPVANAAPEANDQIVRLDEVEVVTGRTSALTQTVTDSKLDAVQPQSVIGLSYISNSVTPTADYVEIMRVAPSVAGISSNGPGLGETKASIRGFQDGEYNVTIDGIPFGDLNGPSHHSTSYWPAKLLGQVVVDRGPGTASTLGQATYGGTVALFSKDPRPDMAFVPTISYGSFNTFLGHFEANTGQLAQANNASLIMSYQYMSTDGYLTNLNMYRNTYYAKYLQPIAQDTTITFVGSYNNIKFNNADKYSKKTQAQIDTLGRRYALSNDPNDFESRYYNYQTKQADMAYIGVKSKFYGDWAIDNKLYTYFYNNDSHESPSTIAGPAKNDIGGQYKVNYFRTWGDVFNLVHDDSVGVLKAGFWYEWGRNLRYNYYLDYNPNFGGPAFPGGRIDQNQGGNNKVQPGYYAGYAYSAHSYLTTTQPFIEYNWHATSALSILAGVKYYDLNRDYQSPFGQGTKLPLYYKHDYTKLAGSGMINYRLSDHMSAYAQIAQGYQAPDLTYFQLPNVAVDSIKPQTTVNYQTGVVFKHDKFNASADAYYINVQNTVTSVPNPNDPVNPIYSSTGNGLYYYGYEAEATYFIGYGTSIYANGSINKSKFKVSNYDVNGIPDSTAALGVLFSSKGGVFASLVDKYVGPATQYSAAPSNVPGSLTGFTFKGGSYSEVSLAGGFSHKLNSRFFHSYKIKLQVENLLDRKIQVPTALSTANVLSYNILPTINYYLTVSGEF